MRATAELRAAPDLLLLVYCIYTYTATYTLFPLSSIYLHSINWQTFLITKLLCVGNILRLSPFQKYPTSEKKTKFFIENVLRRRRVLRDIMFSYAKIRDII